MRCLAQVVTLFVFIFIATSSAAFSNSSSNEAPAFIVTTIDGDIISSKEALGKRPIYLVF